MGQFKWSIFDFTTARGDSIIAEWAAAEKLSKRDLGALNQKIDMLRTGGPTLPPRLFAGPIHAHVYKLIIHGDRMLRPMLCKGPFAMEQEFTFLLGAIEKDDELDADPEDAEKNRATLVKNPQRRKLNERYS